MKSAGLLDRGLQPEDVSPSADHSNISPVIIALYIYIIVARFVANNDVVI